MPFPARKIGSHVRVPNASARVHTLVEPRLVVKGDVRSHPEFIIDVNLTVPACSSIRAIFTLGLTGISELTTRADKARMQ